MLLIVSEDAVDCLSGRSRYGHVVELDFHAEYAEKFFDAFVSARSLKSPLSFLREKPRMVSISSMQSFGKACAIAWIVTIPLGGCKSPQPCCDANLPSRELSWRSGATPERVPPCRQVIPAGVVLEDGLSEDEAVLIALSNNSAFQATLAQLGMAHGDALQASLLANPNYLIYFPTAAKQGQYTLYAPIESYLLRPVRVKAANREYRRIGETLVQNGLDLARDVRVAHADLAVASQQAELAREAMRIRGQILEVTETRLDKGDISELESITAKVDRLNAQAAAGLQQYTVEIAEARLASLIGLTHLSTPLSPMPLDSPSIQTFDEQLLVAQALACRPDYNAAKWAVAAASQRSRLARWLFLRIDGAVDVRSGPRNIGTQTGGGMRFDIPIFNRNQGGIVRADWEINAAQHQRDAIADQIVADVRTSVRQLQQASENLQILEQEVYPALAESLKISQQGFADGGTDYLLVLQSTTQYLDTRGRILDQRAAYARSIAQLERAVGCQITAGLVDVEQLVHVAEIPMNTVFGAEPLAHRPVTPTIETTIGAEKESLGFAALLELEESTETPSIISKQLN